MINLITTNSYFNMFNLLVESIKDKPNGIDARKIIFCEEKVSLMIERMLASKMKGSFNTEVYSFGNFLRVKKPIENLLTSEGSAMVVKKVLSSVNLNCFNPSKDTMAPSLYNLIIELKSAKISPLDILSASEKTEGLLKNKLLDIYTVFSGYEKFISDNKLEDQSSMLSYLPEVIEDTQYLSNASVYLVGFSGFTAQMRAAVNALIKKTSDVTAILCEGDNPLAFVNETATYIKNYAKENDIPLLYNRVESDYNAPAKVLVDNIFNPFASVKESKDLLNDASVYYSSFQNKMEEVERVGQVIKMLVMSGEYRYKDITIAMPDPTYSTYIEKAFSTLDLPFFLDERKKPLHHPLIKLIISYLDVFRKNFAQSSVLSFIKNPFFCQDKELTDRLENYIYKYSLSFNKLREKFTLPEKRGQKEFCLDELNAVMEKFISLTTKFDVFNMLEKLNVSEQVEKYTVQLLEQGKIEDSAINAQIYDAVISLLTQMRMLLGGENLSVKEFKSVFTSGVNALEMSIIPQYNDAVFIGDYKQTALGKAKALFVLGLTASVPNVQQDVSLISDKEIDTLEKIKVLVEPKINIINHRIRENVALALCAFDKSLYLSYPIADESGKTNLKSEILKTVSKLLNAKEFPTANGYLTKKQGLKTFAKDCGEFADGKINEFTLASSYYQASKNDMVDSLLTRANKEVKEQLKSNKQVLIGKEVSPTTIEKYYSCPYNAFLSHSIKLKQREQGNVDVLSVGTLMHDIFCIYAKDIAKVSDKESSDALFESAKLKVIESGDYKKFLTDSVNSTTIDRILSECKKYCYKTYLSLKNSNFEIKATEAKFGEGGFYPAINLLDGKVKMKGKVDRVDESQNFFRVVDYKTGSTDSTDKGLFSGRKLQLFLYGKAVAQKYSDGQKSMAGIYYLPVADKYVNIEDAVKPMADGRTLDDEKAIKEQDLTFYTNGKSEFLPATLDNKGNLKNATSKEDMSQYIDYAVSISELAVSQLKDGVIVPSPYKSSKEDACEYCEYKGLCPNEMRIERRLGTVTAKTIVENPEIIVKGEEELWLMSKTWPYLKTRAIF